jgi:hypothetical protein
VWTRSGDAWTQQGGKLVATGAAGQAHQGFSVSLSADGNTAVVGGPADAGDIGAAWGKLVGTGVARRAQQGSSVALSRDGNTIVLGAPEDNAGTGAAWVFTRSGDAWVQQGSKLVGTEVVGPAALGSSVALSPRRQHHDDGRVSRPGFRRGGVGLHPQPRHLDPARQIYSAWSTRHQAPGRFRRCCAI